MPKIILSQPRSGSACTLIWLYILFYCFDRYHPVKSNLRDQGQADDDDEDIEMSIYEKK